MVVVVVVAVVEVVEVVEVVAVVAVMVVLLPPSANLKVPFPVTKDCGCVGRTTAM